MNNLHALVVKFKLIQMTRKTTRLVSNTKLSFGERFLTEHADAELEFYWAVETKIEIPKNKVLTGIVQKLMDSVSMRLFVGHFKDGIFTFNTHFNDFETICRRSLDDSVIRDNYGNSYTGRQFLEIVSLCESTN